MLSFWKKDRPIEPPAELPAAAGWSPEPRASGIAVDDATHLKNMQQLIELRWIAVIGQVLTILIVHFGFNIHLPLLPMFVLLGALALFNVFSQRLCRRRTGLPNSALLVALLVDVGMLSGQLYLSGGATNPFAFLFLLQVILAAVLLRAWSTWLLVTITCVCFAILTQYSHPLPLALNHAGGLANPFIQAILFCFALNAVLLVVFISRISRNLRARDSRLADLRQRASEEENIVRMGLLASGAAHELGTPLATVAVILSDWRRMPAFTSDRDLLQEIEEMQHQVQRCKTILTGILMSAGEARGESPVQTTLFRFLDELVASWCAGRSSARLAYDRRIRHDLPIVSDSALKQMIGNVLDNAYDASPDWVGLEVTGDDETLNLRIRDNGPGFAPETLARFGKPYNSSKGRPGGGLGLFLVVNVARALGGTVTAENRANGGALVSLTLPLAAIKLKEEQIDAAPSR